MAPKSGKQSKWSGGPRNYGSAASARGGEVVREPENNVYGKYKVLRRTDGTYIVFDTEAQSGQGAISRHRTEDGARAKAESMCGSVPQK